ncbi:MAG: alpha/beta hydrolase [Planctomycetia bacterium]|nr:alpha/beta hydrolase [Planctomycetia bacterium]
MIAILRILLLRNVPFWTQNLWRRRLRWCVAGLYLYVGVLLVLLFLENRLLFAGATFTPEWREPPPELNVREVEIPIAGGSTVVGWFTAPSDWQPHQGAVLYAHGNGGNLSFRARIISLWRKQLNRAVLAYDYPGYGKSPGPVSEAGCYAAGDGAYDWLVQEMKIPAHEIVLLGESLGGAVAIDQAVRRDHRLLITLATFTSFPDIAQFKVPWLPVRSIVRNQFNNIAKISRVRGPVFISHGTADAVTPLVHGESLAAAAREPKRFQPLKEMGHVHPDSEEFWNAIRAFLDETRH